FVEAELERNPLLQREEAEAPVEAAADAGEGGDCAEMTFEEGRSADAVEAVDARADDLYGDAAPGERTSDRMAEEAQPGLSDWSRVGPGGHSGDGEERERPDTREATLWEHLQAQASQAGLSPADHAIALTLIDMVDEGGYLRGDLGEVAERLGIAPERVEAVLTTCHGFEPTGVMARSVPECLKLQLVERNRSDPAMAALLDALDLLARRDLSGLRKICGVDAEDMGEMIAELKALTPRPGAGFGGEP